MAQIGCSGPLRDRRKQPSMPIIDLKCLIVKYIDPIRLGRQPAHRRGKFRFSQQFSSR